MTQKRGEVDVKVEANQAIPDIFENWLNKRVEARSGSLRNREEQEKEEREINRTEDVREKAHRRKRGKGSAAGGS
jgi:hypothetical protein